MSPPARMERAAFALGLGLLWASVPAFAPAADAPPARAPAVEVSLDPPPAADTSSTDPKPFTAPPAAAEPAQSPDAQEIGASAVERPSGTAEPDADPSQADLPPIGPPSGTASELADWVAATGDNGGRPYAIVDKMAADIFVFDVSGRLLGSAPVLVGLARGDDSAAGVGERDLWAISPDERTTPAGRFLAGFGPASGHRTVLWVDYPAAVSLHPVVTTNPKEKRLERLRSRAADDHRITYGCINVPSTFYNDVVLEAFAGGGGVVYILPDTKSLPEVFPAFAALARTGAASNEAAGYQSPQQGPVAQSALPAPNADPDPDRAFDQGAQQIGGSDPRTSAGADDAQAR